ncbi:MAG: hypothetical protein U0793_26320 [Gemmataceae bacterium]
MRHIILLCLVLAAPVSAQTRNTDNLLRNGGFQDDWLTLVPEMKNHHWCYPYDFYNRRDFNPDGWTLKGKWRWENADGPLGTRRLIVEGPAEIKQRVNWVLIHDDRALEGFPDAGGYPVMKAARSKRPERMVRDLKFWLAVTTKNLPEKAAVIEVAVCPPGSTSGDQFGTWTKPIVFASKDLPAGNHDKRAFLVQLPGKAILAALHEQSKDPKEAALIAKEGVLLPGLVQVSFRYVGKEGSVELHEALLTTHAPGGPSLVSNGGFEAVDDKGYPRSWSAPQKYTYFPPRHYYIFNTWHNTNFSNRGKVALDPLIAKTGKGSLRMTVPSGDETAVLSDPIVLNQKEARLIEAEVAVRTDRLAMLQIDAVTDDGQRLDGFNWIHKAPVSIGTDKWRTLRQVFRPRAPVKSFRLVLAARGVNGYTLDGTGRQPQNDVTGTIWWDDVRVTEPESTAEELAARGVKGVKEPPPRTPLDPVDTKEDTFPSEPAPPWLVPIDLRLGALYLAPEQKQYVRMNFGMPKTALDAMREVRLEVIERRSGKALKTTERDASPKAILAQRAKIPVDLRGDFANLLLADLDVSFLPVQSFADPQRNWIVRATAIDDAGKAIAAVDSQPFCRLAHDTPQPRVGKVTVDNNMVFLGGKPWMPFGVTYGHNPVYAGPADPGPGKYRDLSNLPEWSLYDRHSASSTSRAAFDFNCLRYVAGSITPLKTVAEKWTKDNLYCSTAFATPQPAFSLADAFKQAGGKDKLDAYLAACAKDPAVVSVTPGIEEAFGLFLNSTPEELKGLAKVVAYLRKGSGKPVMVGHGGYWNRLEFERVPFFDIFDPETEPLYPANIHTDLSPLVKGKDKVVWLRPQMYESVPYERWRFHTYVELMRGCRGWQIAHGPGDASLFRGLHGEMEFWKPIVASKEKAPEVRIEPWIEHRAYRHKGKTYVIAATTHGIPLGKWTWSEDAPPGGKRSRMTEKAHELRDESNAYAIGAKPPIGLAVHGIQYLPDARVFPRGTKLTQWVKLDGKEPPDGVAILIKADGRWTHAARWGKVDLTPLQEPKTAYWFLNTFYRHAKGFLGWGTDLVPKAMPFVPAEAAALGPLPETGKWLSLELPLKAINAEGKLIEGVGFLHAKGRVHWGRTALVTPDGKEQLVFGDDVGLPPGELAKARVYVPGLKKGARVRVLFEDRDLSAEDGFFVDDFRGADLYQRHGGGYGSGYGDAPVALHLYEME